MKNTIKELDRQYINNQYGEKRLKATCQGTHNTSDTIQPTAGNAERKAACSYNKSDYRYKRMAEWAREQTPCTAQEHCILNETEEHDNNDKQYEEYNTYQKCISLAQCCSPP